MTMPASPLQTARAAYQPKLPKVLAEQGANARATLGAPTTSVADSEAIQRHFPNSYGLPIVTFESGPGDAKSALSVGVILSGGQAPGGHNVIAGLYDGLKTLNSASALYGFLGGPSGLTDNKYIKFDDKFIDAYRNTGGFDIIGSRSHQARKGRAIRHGRPQLQSPRHHGAGRHRRRRQQHECLHVSRILRQESNGY